MNKLYLFSEAALVIFAAIFYVIDMPDTAMFIGVFAGIIEACRRLEATGC
jgi:hypothetical protein